MTKLISFLFLLFFTLQTGFAMVSELDETPYSSKSKFEAKSNDYLSVLAWLSRSPGSSTEDRIKASKKIIGCASDFVRNYSGKQAGQILIQSHLFLANQGEDPRSNFKAASVLARSLNETHLEAEALMGLGSFWTPFQTAKHPRMSQGQITIYTRLLQISMELNDPVLLLKAYLGLGKAGHFSRTNYRQALELSQELGMPNLTAEAYLGLGDIHDGEQVDFYNSALQIAEELSDFSLQCRAHLGLGDAFARNPQVQLYHYDQALQISVRFNDRWFKYRAALGLGKAYRALKDTEQSRIFFEYVSKLKSQ